MAGMRTNRLHVSIAPMTAASPTAVFGFQAPWAYRRLPLQQYGCFDANLKPAVHQSFFMLASHGTLHAWYS